MKNPPMKCKHFCMWCCQRKWSVKRPFIPVLPPAFPSFIHVTTSYKDRTAAEKCWLSFQRPVPCLHWMGNLDKVYFIILLSHWHRNWSQTGWVTEKNSIQKFQRRECIALDTNLLLFVFIYFIFEIATARQQKFDLWDAFPLHPIGRQ